MLAFIYLFVCLNLSSASDSVEMYMNDRIIEDEWAKIKNGKPWFQLEKDGTITRGISLKYTPEPDETHMVEDEDGVRRPVAKPSGVGKLYHDGSSNEGYLFRGLNVKLKKVPVFEVNKRDDSTYGISNLTLVSPNTNEIYNFSFSEDIRLGDYDSYKKLSRNRVSLKFNSQEVFIAVGDIQFEWAGDINGDGFPDLILRIYNNEWPTYHLFMSVKRGETFILKSVVQYTPLAGC